MKYCKMCHQNKDESEFGENKMMNDGLQPMCRQCAKLSKQQFNSNYKQTRHYTFGCCGR